MWKGARRLGAIAAAFALAAATPALAQDQGQGEAAVHERHRGRGHDPEKRIEHLRETLDLSDEQVAQVRTLFSEREDRHRELRENRDREGLRALHEEIHQRLAAVLDDTQREKFESLKREHRERHRDHGARDHADHEEES